MNADTLFIYAWVLFACGWGSMAFLYFFKVVPAVERLHGWKPVLQAALRENLTRHIKEYSRIAREQNNHTMLVVFYCINVGVVVSVVSLLIFLAQTVVLAM
jgi:hypothetical protein